MTSDGLRAACAERTALGVMCVTATPFLHELLAAEDLDFLFLDGQHGLIDHGGMVASLQATSPGGPTPVVRVPANDPTAIGQALDAGAAAVVVPLVESAAEAARAVAACRYPPDGRRSFGPTRSALSLGIDPTSVNGAVLCFVMVETVAGLEAVEEIAAVRGVDGIYVGPTDLSVTLGRGPLPRPDEPPLGPALDRILAATAATGRIAGIHALDGAGARHYADRGFRFVTVGTDASLLLGGARRQLRVARER